MRLCLVTHRQGHVFQDYAPLLLQAIQGGVTCIQLREKDISDKEFEEISYSLLNLLKPYRVPLILNDRVNLVEKIGAQGIHLGQKDMHPDEARSILGDNKIIGLSIESLEELENANKLDSITYVAASSVFLTSNKSDCKMFWGIEGLKKFCKISNHPVIGIGGINISNLESVLNTGAQGVSVIGAIHAAKNPLEAAQEIRRKIDQFFSEEEYDTHAL